MAVEAVTFDHWNTLVYEERGQLRGKRLEAWSGILEDAGFATERQQLEKVFDSAWEQYVSNWTAGEQYHATQAAEHILEVLGFEVPIEVQEALGDAFTSVSDGVDFFLVDGIEECLRSLKDAGVRLGIICDVGFTPSSILRDHLIRRGLLPLFDHWSFSDDVGFYKPAPEIFEHALEGLGGVEPERVAHVGDLRRTDVAGAIGMGMIAVRYAGVFDDDSTDHPEAHHVIADMRDLAKVLGI
jgi:putative hydrolase of the HAD superfamily